MGCLTKGLNAGRMRLRGSGCYCRTSMAGRSHTSIRVRTHPQRAPTAVIVRSARRVGRANGAVRAPGVDISERPPAPQVYLAVVVAVLALFLYTVFIAEPHLRQ